MRVQQQAYLTPARLSVRFGSPSRPTFLQLLFWFFTRAGVALAEQFIKAWTLLAHTARTRMTQPDSSSSFLGLSYGWSYALASFTLVICGCLPLALLAVMGHSGSGAERANALMAWLPVMAGVIGAVCAVVYWAWLRQHTAWQRRVLLLLWALSALGMVGWWKL